MAGSRGEERRPQPARITNARQGSTREFESRRRQYMIAMGIRTLCFLLSTILYFTHVINIWVCAIIFVAAVVLPSFAVAVANQANTRSEDQEKFDSPAPADARQLTTGPDQTGQDEGEVISGTVEDEYGTVPDPQADQADTDHVGDPRRSDEQTHHRGAA